MHSCGSTGYNCPKTIVPLEFGDIQKTHTQTNSCNLVVSIRLLFRLRHNECPKLYMFICVGVLACMPVWQLSLSYPIEKYKITLHMYHWTYFFQTIYSCSPNFFMPLLKTATNQCINFNGEGFLMYEEM